MCYFIYYFNLYFWLGKEAEQYVGEPYVIQKEYFFWLGR
jgi:hypothetical protein